MLSIPRSVARLVRATFRKMGDTNATRSKLVTFGADNTGLRLQSRTDEIGVEYRIDGPFPAMRFVVPLDSLADCEGQSESPVEFKVESDGDIRMEWTDAGVPQRKHFVGSKEVGTGLNTPESFQSFGDGTALRSLTDAMKSTPREHARFALSRIQLRGAKGDVVGTDGRQLLVVRGLQFPWTDNLLVPRTRLFETSPFLNAESVQMARTDDHVIVRAGPWTAWLTIDKNGRFPNVDQVIPSSEGSTRIVLTDEDAQFLLRSVPRLPADEDEQPIVTIHANGQVVIRAKSSSSPLTELVLNRSRTIGNEARVNTPREHLCRAIMLGIREFRLTNDRIPIVGEASDRTFVFLPFQGRPALGPSDEAIRIESVSGQTPVPHPTPRSPITMPDKIPNDHAEARDETSDELVGDPIQEAEAVRTLLRDVLNKVGRLLLALKRQRRQSQLVRSTLASLKQLQEVA